MKRLKFSRPTFLVDEEKCRKNIEKMAIKAKASGVLFRPHFKTHQSAAIGGWFRDMGVNKITVSSVEMAEYFAGHGWVDILVAFPVNIREIEAINRLAKKIKLNLLVESVFSAGFLAQNLTAEVSVYIEIDTGNARSGLTPNEIPVIREIAAVTFRSDRMKFRGLLAHDGHTYQSNSAQEILDLHRHSVDTLLSLRHEIEKEFRVPLISTGDTPACSLVERFEGIDEIRPGNFVFYDVMQHALGACATGDISVAVACPVVAVYPQRGEIVIHGGAVHLSKETVETEGQTHFGLVAPLSEQGWGEPFSDCFVKWVSQEHGVVQASQTLPEKIRIGDVVAVLPVHSCLTANQFRHYYLLDGRRLKTFHT